MLARFPGGGQLGGEPVLWRLGHDRGYKRLDASEKSSVSYFLGMTQAKITCQRLLGASHMIHLDAYLAMIGQPAAHASRPDLVGVGLPSTDCTIAVEAKDRSGSRTAKVTDKAKEQAKSLPGIMSTSSASALHRSRPLTHRAGGMPTWRIRQGHSSRWTR